MKGPKLAGEKRVIAEGANNVRKAIPAGLVDEISIDLVPVLLVEGIRYLGALGNGPVQLECLRWAQGAKHDASAL